MSEHAKRVTREEQAKAEIGHTTISPPVKWTLLAVGLFTLFAVPLVQTYLDIRPFAAGTRKNPRPQCCDIFEAVPRAMVAYSEGVGDWVSRVQQGNTALLQSIDHYEKELKAESFLTQSIQPPTQELLVRTGSGNEKAYVGRQGWLFYRPGIDYCTGPGFLNARQVARRTDSGTEFRSGPQADPRAAILQFHRQLAERDIRLVLMPVPDKATVHPESSPRDMPGGG